MIPSGARVMVKFPNWIGDAVLATAGLVHLRTTRPDLYLAGVFNPWVSDLFRNNSHLDELIIYTYRRGIKRFVDGSRFVSKLRSRHFSAAVLFHGAFESALLPFLARIPIRIGRPKDNQSMLLTERILWSPVAGRLHQVYIYLEIARAASGRAIEREPEPSLQICPEDYRAAVDLLQWQPESRPVVVFAPGAAYGSAKRWLPERFSEVSQILSHSVDAKIIICGGNQDSALASEITARCNPKPMDLTGKYPLMQQAAVISLANAVVANDSGLMHVAAAVGTPVMAVFGPTDPKATGPLGRGHHIFQSLEPCAPCHEPECIKEHQCMKAISASEVARKIEQIIGETAGSRAKLRPVLGS